MCAHRIWSFFFLIFALFTSSCHRQSIDSTPDVIILHTGRIRGNIYPLSLQGIAPLQHYPYLAGYIRQVREEASKKGTQVILIDLGDSLEGSFASFTTNSSNVIEFFNALRYDAILLGNLDSSIQPLQIESLQVPCLIPFIKKDGSPCIPNIPTAAKISRPNDRFSVYLIANFYGDTDPAQYPERFPVSFAGQTGIQPVRNIESQIASLGQIPADSLVLFAWQKFEAPNSQPTQFLQRLLKAGVDAILAQRVYGRQKLDAWADAGPADWNPPISQNILRNNGGFTIARLDLKRENNRWRVLRQQIIPMTANVAPPDPAIIARIESFAETIRKANISIGEASQPISENQILNLVLNAFTSLPNATAAIYTIQSVRSSLPSGTVTSSHLYRALPWNSPLVSLSLSAEELQILQSKNKDWTIISIKDHSSNQKHTVICPEFLARIALQQLNLEAQFQIVSESEFSFLANFTHNFAANNGGTLIAPKFAAPDGWQIHKPNHQ
ncbi:MAG: 5'-nucleotidase C-terminal domain-containing protein [Chthoniobacterales bacterium]|nr:5'-nucleotidase C-terminal domain-containing protein [Chthoniobacterales bacterium]